MKSEAKHLNRPYAVPRPHNRNSPRRWWFLQAGVDRRPRRRLASDQRLLERLRDAQPQRPVARAREVDAVGLDVRRRVGLRVRSEVQQARAPRLVCCRSRADRVASMRCGRSTIENHCVASAVKGGKVMPTTWRTPACAQLSYMRFSDLKVASASHLHRSFVPARMTTAPGVLDFNSSLSATSTCPAVRSGSADTRTSTGVKMSFFSSFTTTLATGSKPPSPPATSPASKESPTMLQLKRASRRLFVLRAPAVASAQKDVCPHRVSGAISRGSSESYLPLKALALVRRSVSRRGAF